MAPPEAVWWVTRLAAAAYGGRDVATWQEPERIVGTPLLAIWLLLPRCRFKYHPVAGGGDVTPVKVATTWLTSPAALATRSGNMYSTGPCTTHDPRWIWAACWEYGTRPLAWACTVKVMAEALYDRVALPCSGPVW